MGERLLGQLLSDMNGRTSEAALQGREKEISPLEPVARSVDPVLLTNIKEDLVIQNQLHRNCWNPGSKSLRRSWLCDLTC